MQRRTGRSPEAAMLAGGTAAVAAAFDGDVGVFERSLESGILELSVYACAFLKSISYIYMVGAVVLAAEDPET